MLKCQECISVFVYIFLYYLENVASQVSPKLAPVPREVEFRRGQRFQSVCSSREGDLPLTFNWVRNGQPLVESAEVSVRRLDDFSSSLTISAVREDHAGNYTCTVSNVAGRDSSTIRLRVLVPPTWLRQPYDMSVLSGTRVTLNCETAGTPKPTVTWRRTKGFNVQQMEPLAVTHWRTGEDGSLTTTNIKKEDEGFYSCEVSNGVGDGLRKTVRMEVQVPPSVATSDPVKTVKKGDTAKLLCNVTGDSPLTVMWTKANQQLVTGADDRLKVEEDTTGENTSSVVVIRKLSSDDTGLYYCSARNTFGQSQAAVRLRVVEPPSPPQEFRATDVWCRSIRMEWKQPYNGNSPLKNYVIKYKKKDGVKVKEIEVPKSQRAVVVKDLRPYTSYELQAIAENEVGPSNPSINMMVTTREEEPEGVPTNVYLKDKDATGFTISWKAPSQDRWNGELLGFYVGYKKLPHGSHKVNPFTYKVLPLDHSAELQEYHMTGVEESSTYKVVVRAYNNAGIGPLSEPITIKTSYGESPQVPSVTFVSAQQSVIKLKVEPTGRRRASPSEYVLHIREGSGSWQKIPLIPDTEIYSVGGLNPGGQYKLYITARNKFGDSGPSEVLNFQTESGSNSGSIFSFEDDEAIPFYQRLSFIIPVAVSLTTILVVPIAACCCLHKLSTLSAIQSEGVEARGFTYTAAPLMQGECTSTVQSQTLPQVSNSIPVASQSHYSTLQNYGSVIPCDSRFGTVMEEIRVASEVNIPPKRPPC